MIEEEYKKCFMNTIPGVDFGDKVFFVRDEKIYEGIYEGYTVVWNKLLKKYEIQKNVSVPRFNTFKLRMTENIYKDVDSLIIDNGIKDSGKYPVSPLFEMTPNGFICWYFNDYFQQVKEAVEIIKSMTVMREGTEYDIDLDKKGLIDDYYPSKKLAIQHAKPTVIYMENEKK